MRIAQKFGIYVSGTDMLAKSGGGGWTRTNDLRIMRTQAVFDPIGKFFYFTLLFNGFQVDRFDPFCFVVIHSDRATITIS